MNAKPSLDLDLALEEVAKKVKPVAAIYTINPSQCETQNCQPQCDCCSDFGCTESYDTGNTSYCETPCCH